MVVSITELNPFYYNSVLQRFIQVSINKNINNTSYKIKLQNKQFYQHYILCQLSDILDLELLVTKLLTCIEPIKEASLHCVSCKLSKPRSQLRFCPTCQKIVKTHLVSGLDVDFFPVLLKHKLLNSTSVTQYLKDKQINYIELKNYSSLF